MKYNTAMNGYVVEVRSDRDECLAYLQGDSAAAFLREAAQIEASDANLIDARLDSLMRQYVESD